MRGVPRHETGNQRGQYVTAECGAGGDAQLAARFVLQIGDGGAGQLQLLKHRLHALEVQRAGVGQCQAAGGAGEQAQPQALLQAGNVLARCRCADTQQACASSDAAALDGLHETLQAAQGVRAFAFQLDVHS